MTINFAYDEEFESNYFNVTGDNIDLGFTSCSLHYWFEKNGINVNLMTLDEAIDSGENFVYWIYLNPPWDISRHIESLSDDLIGCINSGICNFVINDAIEGRDWPIEETKIFVKSLQAAYIDMSKVIVLTQSWSYLYNDMPFRMVYWSWHESNVSAEAERGEIAAAIHPQDLHFPENDRHDSAKKFLCLNRYNKQDRFYFIYQMYKHNLLHEFNCSHSKVTGPDDFDVWNLRSNSILGPIQLASWPWTDDMTEFAKTTPYTYDEVTEDFELILVEPRHRQENYIFIVTESIFNDNRPDRPFDGMTRDVSEKTWKPIALRMPFIVIHQPFALKRLRDVGYKTFHTIWDESYDDITDPEERMSAIVDLVVSLSKRKDFIDMVNSCDKIVEHNFAMLRLRSPEQDMIREVSNFNFQSQYNNLANRKHPFFG